MEGTSGHGLVWPSFLLLAFPPFFPEASRGTRALGGRHRYATFLERGRPTRLLAEAPVVRRSLSRPVLVLRPLAVQVRNRFLSFDGPARDRSSRDDLESSGEFGHQCSAVLGFHAAGALGHYVSRFFQPPFEDPVHCQSQHGELSFGSGVAPAAVGQGAPGVVEEDLRSFLPQLGGPWSHLLVHGLQKSAGAAANNRLESVHQSVHQSHPTSGTVKKPLIFL